MPKRRKPREKSPESEEEEEQEEVHEISSDDESLPIAERLRRLRKKKADTTLANAILEQDLERLEELAAEEERAVRAEEERVARAEEERAQRRRDKEEAGPSRARRPSGRRSAIQDTDDESVAERVQKRRKTDYGKKDCL